MRFDTFIIPSFEKSLTFIFNLFSLLHILMVDFTLYLNFFSKKPEIWVLKIVFYTLKNWLKSFVP